jgi:phosphatidylethanolamine/phosphatidyl-N-methylethanolamine N-methyltransferase
VKKAGFFLQSLKNFQEMGSIARSSPQMCRKMSQFVPKDQDVIIIELGAGDGAITEHILARMTKNSKLLAFEINPELFEVLQEINDPRLIPINDGAENLPKYMEAHKIEGIDIAISAIPFLVLPEELMNEILIKVKDSLRIGGIFTQMHYATTLKSVYQNLFGNIDAFFVPLNIPPGYVFKCIKQ